MAGHDLGRIEELSLPLWGDYFELFLGQFRSGYGLGLVAATLFSAVKSITSRGFRL